MGSLPCVRQTACGGKEARHGGKEHINGKSDGERNKKAALRRAEAAGRIEAGVARAMELGGTGPVCALGTLYFSGDVRQAFAAQTKG